VRNNFGFWSLVVVLLKFLLGVVDQAAAFGRSSLVVLYHMNCMNSPYISSETMCLTQNVLECKNVLEVLYHCAKFAFARRRESQKC